MSLIPTGFAKSAAAGGFYSHTIDQSLRLNDDDSAYLSRTPASAGNRKTWTWSGWVKRGNITSINSALFGAGDGGNNQHLNIWFDSSYRLYVETRNAADSAWIYLTSESLLRDPSAWYHIVIKMDTTQASASDRLKMYINGVEPSYNTDNRSSISQNDDMWVNGAVGHYIGKYSDASIYYNDGYLAEVHFIDGQALDASSFGEFKSGVWIPKAYSGSYGTNGFYLPFNHDYSVEGFSATTYTGNGGSQYVGGIGFNADLIWIKNRSRSGTNHRLTNSVIGADYNLLPNVSDGEKNDAEGIDSFENDGFYVTRGSYDDLNTSGDNYVAWAWDAGSGSPVSNTDGSITSTVKASTTYGFSIVSYTGTGSAVNTDTVGHGLGVKPDLYITKNRDTANSWLVRTDLIDGSSDFLLLDGTAAKSDSAVNYADSSVFSLGSSNGDNGSGDAMIAYCFHSVSGYSKFGSYTGTGASGNSVTTGFKPAFVMIKAVNGGNASSANWSVFDNVRKNGDSMLRPNLSNGDSNFDYINFTDTGFDHSAYLDYNVNESGTTYIYMAFADKREAAFWLDQSGNNNDFENNNLTESDISLDSPTNNFATLNSVDPHAGNLQEGNLEYENTDSLQKYARSTFAQSAGKWYFETAFVSDSNPMFFGVSQQSETNDSGNAYVGNSAKGWGCQITTTVRKVNSGTLTQIDGTNYRSTANVFQCAVDLDAGKIWFGVNNTWFASGDPSAGTNAVFSNVDGEVTFNLGTQTSTDVIANFGQDSSFAGNKTAQGNTDANGIGDFYYAPPSGYLALCTANLPEPAFSPADDASPQDYFNTVLYAGTDANDHSISGVGFQPDFVWIKDRVDGSRSHYLFDVIRGNARLLSNNTAAEVSNDSDASLDSFDSDGFTIDGIGINDDASGNNYVAWNWKANGSGVSNTDGSITSTVSANTDAGFSIVSYTGNATAGATIGHGLDSAPEMVIVKVRSTTNNWPVYHVATGNGNYTLLNNTAASAADEGGFWNGTTPSDSVVSLGSAGAVNASSATFIAYCFHSVDGFSKFGSYTGNGSSDGPFVYTGFRPAFVMIKIATGDTGQWVMYDTARDTYNAMDLELQAESSNAENQLGSNPIDCLSNGFKIRSSTLRINRSTSTFIYMCFSENPFKYSNAR